MRSIDHVTTHAPESLGKLRGAGWRTASAAGLARPGELLVARIFWMNNCGHDQRTIKL
jgi:hypothetical protein